MNNEIIVPELNEKTIETMIYEIRGQRVMLDFDLAKIYGYATRDFNNQVKNNIERFDIDFRFQLTKEELNKILMLKNSTSSWGGVRKLPYAFTEQGIYMLMTVLKGELAVKQSKTIIRLFKQMKDYIVESNNLTSSDELLKLTNKVYSNEKNIEKLKNDNRVIRKKLEVVMDNFIDPSTYKHFLILNGEKIEAIIAYESIFKLAKQSIYIIDDYIDVKTLQNLKICKQNIKIIIFSDDKNSKYLNNNYINDFRNDTKLDITFKKNNNIFHGRYIILDFNTKYYKIYHSGPSIKDAGGKIDTINIIDEKEAYIPLINKILENEEYYLK